MKKIIAFILFLVFNVASFAQLNDSTYRQTVKNEFLKKSRNQRTTGFILLGSGAALIMTGVLMVNNSNDDILNPGNWVDAGAGVGITTIGGLSAIASVPFFIMSANNSKKARQMSAGVKMEKLYRDKIKPSDPQFFPAITARLHF